MLITGEEIASLQSTIARIFVIEMQQGDVNRGMLSGLQAKAGLLPHAMTSYIHWVRDKLEDIKRKIPVRFAELRQKATEGTGHLKLPEQTAFMTLTLEFVSSWLMDKGIFSAADAEALLSEGWDTFRRLTERHGERIRDEDPVKKFEDIILSLCGMGKATLEKVDEQ